VKPTKVEVVEAEVLRLQPDEILILRLPEGADLEMVDLVADALSQVGLKDRSLVLSGEIDIAVIGPR